MPCIYHGTACTPCSNFLLGWPCTLLWAHCSHIACKGLIWPWLLPPFLACPLALISWVLCQLRLLNSHLTAYLASLFSWCPLCSLYALLSVSSHAWHSYVLCSHLMSSSHVSISCPSCSISQCRCSSFLYCKCSFSSLWQISSNSSAHLHTCWWSICSPCFVSIVLLSSLSKNLSSSLMTWL